MERSNTEQHFSKRQYRRQVTLRVCLSTGDTDVSRKPWRVHVETVLNFLVDKVKVSNIEMARAAAAFSKDLDT